QRAAAGEQAPEALPEAEPAPAGMFSRLRHPPEPEVLQPELVEPDPHYDDTAAAPDAGEVSARITDAIRHHRADPEPEARQPAEDGRSTLAAVTARLTGRGPVPPASPAESVRAAVPPPPQAASLREPVPVPASSFDSSLYEHPPLSLLAAPATVERHTASPE